MTSRLVSCTATVVMSVVWLAAVAVSVAWVSGLVSADGSIADPDYLWRPLSISDGTRLGLGLAATMVMLGHGWLLFRSNMNGNMTRLRRAVLIPAAAVAAYGGLTYSAAPAPTIGANIGGALMLLGAAPFFAAMVIVAGVMIRRGRSTSPT